MTFDQQALNADNVAYAAGSLPDVIDLGGEFSLAVNPGANYAVKLSAAATAAVTVTVQAATDSAMTSPKTVATFVIPIGAKYGYVPLGLIPARYLGATVAGVFVGNITAGIVNGVQAPIGMGLGQGV